MNTKKYLITLWKNEFDYDGLTSEFSVLGEFYDLKDTQARLKELSNELLAELLREHTDWRVVDIGRKEHRKFYDRVNSNSKVVGRSSFKITDGGGYNSLYNYLELIELAEDTQVNENLFDLEHCGFEVKQYFDGLRTKSLQK